MKAFSVFLFFLSLAVGSLTNISPEIFWPSSILGFAIPFLLVLNFVLLVFWSFKKSLFLLWHLVILVAGFGFIKTTYNVSSQESVVKEKAVSVLSFNLSGFNRPKGFYFDDNKIDNSLLSPAFNIKKWVASNKSDIKCFQEFYHDENSGLFNTLEDIRKAGTGYYYLSVDSLGVNKAKYGLAIFSKHPIVNQGEVFVSDNRFNRAAFADIKIDSDTIRIINVHMQSAQLMRKSSTFSGGESSGYKTFYYKLKQAAYLQGVQSRALLSFIESSPYKVIVCGDFNSSPYSYIYQKLSRTLNNAFEEKGDGFGFTFNKGNLFLLRIDHLFASPDLNVLDFRTHNEVKLSEHYPIQALYKI